MQLQAGATKIQMPMIGDRIICVGEQSAESWQKKDFQEFFKTFAEGRGGPTIRTLLVTWEKSGP